FLLAEARERGWGEQVGIEPSAFASAYARDRLGLDVRTDDLFAAPLPGHRFDAVVLGDVIEHLPRPGDARDRTASRPAPGGVASPSATSISKSSASSIPSAQTLMPTSLAKLTSAAISAERLASALTPLTSERSSFTRSGRSRSSWCGPA